MSTIAAAVTAITGIINCVFYVVIARMSIEDRESGMVILVPPVLATANLSVAFFAITNLLG